jgi:hypothetical protein
MKHAKLSDAELLFLLQLIFTGSEPTLTEAALNPKSRSKLAKQGLISIVPAEGRAKKIQLEDAAWAIASRELGRNIKVKLPRRGAVLPKLAVALLPTLAAFLTRRDVVLAEFVGAGRKAPPAKRRKTKASGRSPSTKKPAPGMNGDRGEQLIRSAYLERTGGELGVRVRIRELREATDELSSAEFDRGLRALVERGAIKAFGLDDPHEKTSADERAAFDLSGVKRHVVYLET